MKPGDRPASGTLCGMTRLCERPGCSQVAEMTYGFDAEHLMVWIDSYDRVSTDRAGVLCRRHADAMVVPLGWMLDDRRDPVPRLFKAPAQPLSLHRGSGGARGTIATTPNNWNSLPTSIAWPSRRRRLDSDVPTATRDRGHAVEAERSIRPTISTVFSRPAVRYWRGRSAAKGRRRPTSVGRWMDITASLEAPCAADQLFELVDDLSTYPQWNGLVHSAVAEPGDDPVWDVQLRARLGPLARSKRLRMVRTVRDAEALTRHVRTRSGRRSKPFAVGALAPPSSNTTGSAP